MGALLARIQMLFQRGDWQPGRVRKIYEDVITKDERFFQKVMRCKESCSKQINSKVYGVIFKKNPHIENLFFDKKRIADADEREYVLNHLSEALHDFFDTLFKNDMYTNEKKFRRFCFDCGERHRAYGGRQEFKVKTAKNHV